MSFLKNLFTKDFYNENPVTTSNHLDNDNEILQNEVADGAGRGGVTSKNKMNGYYNSAGQYLGSANESKNEVFLADGLNEDNYINEKTNKKETTYWAVNAQKLDISHSDFKFCAGVLKLEGTSKSVDEMSAIAWTTRNSAGSISKMRAKLNSSYSRAPKKFKKELNPKDNSSIARNARAGMIFCLTENDITDNAVYWDGEDFLAWGKDRPARAGGGEFPKLVEGVVMSLDIYEEYRDAILEKYSSGKISYMKNYGVVCEIPNRVFLDSNNWKENGTVFKYRTNGKNPKLEATFTAGRSIFWKKR